MESEEWTERGTIEEKKEKMDLYNLFITSNTLDMGSKCVISRCALGNETFQAFYRKIVDTRDP